MALDAFDTAARFGAYAIGAGILVNVVDDAFVDARYFLGRLGAREKRLVSKKALDEVEQRRIAIMLPAWKEAEVIEQMIAHNLERVDYRADRIAVFCGTYQNDPETQERVDAVVRRLPNVHKVVVPHDGPTSKADCLNWIYQGIVLEEKRAGERFEILLMHDAEDVIHPLSLRLYSLLIPPHELVQTPVFSLPLPMRKLVAGTYIDEFAEHHQKDMRVREAIGGMVPSAGVGTAFSRDAFEEIAIANEQKPFNVDSLTEDYEIGLKFRLAGRKAHFACCAVEIEDGDGVREEVIATREFFPSGFWASVRQRSRWILGITMQTWEQIGWPGGPSVLYCLWRDRKAVITNALVLAAYALLFYFLSRLTADELGLWAWTREDVVPRDSVLVWVLGFNFAFAGWRMAMKAFFVGRLYGLRHAVLSVPRVVLGNVIGVLATGRAASQYMRHRVSGKPLRWLKTAHEFPAADRLALQRTIGEYLLEEHALTSSALDEAVALQRLTGAALDDVIATGGFAEPTAVAEAVARQHSLTSVIPQPSEIALPVLRRLPEELAEKLDVLPLEEKEGVVVIATPEPLADDARSALEDELECRVEQRIADRDSVRPARERAYRRLVSDPPPAPTTSAPAGTVEADRRAVLRLGLGFCTFHGVVPVRAGGATHILASTALHPSVVDAIALRLNEAQAIPAPRPEVVPAAPATVRIALAAIEGSLPVPASESGLFGLDAVECHALRKELPAGQGVEEVVNEARTSGLSPLELLERLRNDDPEARARARARTFGIPLANRGRTAAGLLPPRLAAEHDVTVIAQDGELIELAAPRPTPRLAQEVASLLAPLKVAWNVAPPGRSHPE